MGLQFHKTQWQEEHGTGRYGRQQEQEQEADWPYINHKREVKNKLKLGCGYKSSKPTPQWYSSSS